MHDILIFQALGVYHTEEIDYIKDYFTPYTKCGKCNQNPFEIGTEVQVSFLEFFIN
jgi:hypothetical protein